MTTNSEIFSNSTLSASTGEGRALGRFIQWMFTALAAGSFASLLLILETGWRDVSALQALACFAISLPVLAGAALMYGEPRDMYIISVFMRLASPLAVVAFIVGISLLIGRVHGGIAVLFGVMTLLQAVMLAGAHHRRRMHAISSHRISSG